MHYFKCIQNKDGKVVMVHNLDQDGGKLGRITFDDNERFAENQVKEGDIVVINYGFTQASLPPAGGGPQFPDA